MFFPNFNDYFSDGETKISILITKTFILYTKMSMTFLHEPLIIHKNKFSFVFQFFYGKKLENTLDETKNMAGLCMVKKFLGFFKKFHSFY